MLVLVGVGEFMYFDGTSSHLAKFRTPAGQELDMQLTDEQFALLVQYGRGGQATVVAPARTPTAPVPPAPPLSNKVPGEDDPAPPLFVPTYDDDEDDEDDL